VVKNYQMINKLSCGVFDFAQIWYRVRTYLTRDVLQTFKVKGSKVKVTAWHNNG